MDESFLWRWNLEMGKLGEADKGNGDRGNARQDNDTGGGQQGERVKCGKERGGGT